MVSGKYSALAGAISREQSIADIANNLANVTTTGYKRSVVSFESLLAAEQQDATGGINHSRVAKSYTDFSPGPLKQTANPLDFALNGEGFFKLRGENGTVYTRRGDFQVDAEGTLRTSNGMAVLDDADGEITIADMDTGSIAVASDGTIYINTPDGGRSEAGRLAIVNIDDTSLLRREKHTTFSLQQGGNEIAAEQTQVIQGSLEMANVNMTQEMTKMINSYRTFETYHKILESYSTIAEEQDELGTLA